MASVKISKDIQQGGIAVVFSYEPKLVAKAKSIEGHRWQSDKKRVLLNMLLFTPCAIVLLPIF